MQNWEQIFFHIILIYPSFFFFLLAVSHCSPCGNWTFYNGGCYKFVSFEYLFDFNFLVINKKFFVVQNEKQKKNIYVVVFFFLKNINYYFNLFSFFFLFKVFLIN